MNRIISSFIILIIFCLVLSSCSSSVNVYKKEFDDIYKNIHNIPVLNSDDYYICETNIAIDEAFECLFYIKSIDSILCYDNNENRLALVELAECKLTFIEDNSNIKRISNIVVSDDWIAYIVTTNDDLYSLEAYNIKSNDNRTVIKAKKDRPTYYNSVIIGDNLYYDKLYNGGISEEYDCSIFSLDLTNSTEKIVCEHAVMPMNYKSNLCFVVNNSKIVTWDNGTVNELYDLKELNLYKEVSSINCSNDVLSYTYWVMSEDATYATGGGVGFVNNAKRFDFIESEKSSYPSTLEANNNYIIWNETSYQYRPMFYDRLRNAFVILDKDPSFYTAYLGDDKIIFCSRNNTELHIITVSCLY